MRDVSTVLGFKYPNMFQVKGDVNVAIGYGLGGSQGNKNLPQHLVERGNIRLLSTLISMNI